jgi:hypothetical protein
MKTAFGGGALGSGMVDGCRASVGVAVAVGSAVAAGTCVTVGVGIAVGSDVGFDGVGLSKGDGDAADEVGIGTGVAAGSTPTQAPVRSAMRSRQSPRMTFIPSTVSPSERLTVDVAAVIRSS